MGFKPQTVKALGGRGWGGLQREELRVLQHFSMRCKLSGEGSVHAYWQPDSCWNTGKCSCAVISAWNGVKLANALAAVVCSTCSLIDFGGGLKTTGNQI